jgi:hypothetical protein
MRGDKVHKLASIAVPARLYRCVACGRRFRKLPIRAHHAKDFETLCRGFLSDGRRPLSG